MKTKVLAISNDSETIDEIRQGFAICLPDTGLTIVNTGIDGIKQTKEGILDLVIIDMSITDITPWDTFSQIRQNMQAPVILLSYSHEEYDIVKALEMGFDTYISKPFRELEFMAHIRSILRRNKPGR